MVTKRRHIISASFCAVLALPLLALFLLQVVQIVLKHTAAHRMAHEVLQTIRIPADKVVWEKMGKEIVLEGKMFDIREYGIRDGIFTATGFFDEKETGIRDYLLKYATGKDAGILLARLLFFAQCFVVAIGWYLPPLFFITLRKSYPFYKHRYLNPFLPFPGPPPRFH